MQSPKLILSLLFAFLVQNHSFGQTSPKYAAMVGGKESGQIKRGEFLAQQGVGGMRFIAGNHWERIPIDSFSIVVLRDTSIILQLKNIGQVFTDNSKNELKKLMASDRVLIYNIHGRDYGNKSVSIRPVELIIE
jgi:hypothetical protein